ncbi:MAG TPA: hypothetical protein VHI13_12810 [Candidatus Kapabacteria bacterium]|nr:hypothetical protein [Candidatus Kapabacteria bacterium]
MRSTCFLATVVLAVVAFFAAPSMRAQSDTTKTNAATVDTLGSALLNEFDKDFDNTFKSVKSALEKAGYVVNYSSKKYKRIETDFKKLADEDTFDEEMEKYGDVPYMRSPGWTTGRVKIFVNFEVVDSNKTAVKVLAQLSGYESRFTNAWHYWRSNGKIEEVAMNFITKEMEDTK